MCWICGHLGADSLDHVIPRSLAPELAEDPGNLRAAHYSPCPVCARRCNASRGNRMFGPSEPRRRRPKPSRVW
jgi:5-methylcytosine-specific restriction endonuclease McrA